MYSQRVLKEFERRGISVGDRVSIEMNGKKYEGLLMEHPGTDTDVIEIKLDNGYNIGIQFNGTLALVEKRKPAPTEKRGKWPAKYDLSVLMFGGTISSRVEYRTGAVFPAVSPEEFSQSFPELKAMCTARFRKVFSVLSEDMNIDHWKEMGKEVYSELESGRCVVITHGTDTMGYSAAALSFMVLNPKRPVVLTGAQRSSDRGSSDSRENFLNSAYYAKNGKPGVFVCMHATSSDGPAHIHLGTRVRKMHTSRRDAFKSVNALPVAEVDFSKNGLKYLWEYKEPDGKMELRNSFSDNVALIYTHPNIKPEFVSKLSEYDGVVIAGSGLGHVPSNPFGDRMAKPIINEVRGLVESGVHVVIAPQTLYGRINLNVYTAGRMLKEAGVIGHLCDWLPETAFVKLCWVLGQTKKRDEVKKMMLTNYAGEIGSRSLLEHYY